MFHARRQIALARPSRYALLMTNASIASNETSEEARLNAITVVATIFAFWLFYSALVTLRAYVVDFPAQDEMAMRRVVVTALSMLITVLLWLVLRPFDRKPLALRVAMVALLAMPAAYAIASINYVAFYVYEPDFMLQTEAGKAIVEGAKPDHDLWVELFETAISRYFFLIAWASLYLALGFVMDVRAAERRAAGFARAAQMAELRALRYQINPHFLFNSLNSLSALVMADRRDEAEDMILSLSRFYRTALSGDSTGDVSLGEEIEVQRLYLAIETRRFSNRLSVVIDVPDALMPLPVPGLILQPLVENAIKHGVSATAERVEIGISARREGDALVLRVNDNAPPTSKAMGGEGIGLQNVRDRLEARYGKAASMQASPGSDSGFTVTLRLPVAGQETMA